MADQEAENSQTWHISGSLHLFPLVAISAIYLVIGVVGNSTVCFVSIVRMRRSVLNNFVLALAFAELVGCMFTIPIEITQIINIYSFDYPLLCKFERYLRTFIIFFTSCLLIAIATERYQRIVKPHRKHVTSFQFWITIVCSLLFSSIASIPEAILSGTEVLITDYGIGHICSTYSSDEYVDTIFPSLWACFVVVVYVISTTAIGSLYCVIAVQIWKRGKLMTDSSRRSRPNTPDLTLRRRVDHLRHDFAHARKGGLGNDVDTPPAAGIFHSLPRSHFRRREDPDEITPLPEIRVRDHQRSSVPDNTEGVNVTNNKTNGLENGDASESVEEKRTSKERNSLFSEILSYFQSKSATLPSCGSFHEKRTSQSMSNNDKEKENTGAEQEHIQQLRSHKNPEVKVSVSRQQSDRREKSDQPPVQIEQQNHPRNQKQQQEQHDSRRKLTAVFFDELAVTVDHRRRRATFSAYGPDTSCEDLLSPHTFSPTPHSLTPMGSVRSRGGGYSRKRTTFIMFIMTLTTVLSLLPHVIVMLYRLHQPSIEIRLSPDDSVFFRVAWNSFFISLAAHPYVYGFWNGRFKKALLSLFHDVRKEGRRGIDRVRKGSSVCG